MKSLVALVCVLIASMASVGEAGIFRNNHRHNNHRHNRNFNYGYHKNFGHGYGGYSGGYVGSTVIVQQPATQAPVIAAPPAAQAAPVAPQPAPATDGGLAQAIKDLSKLGPVEIVITPDGRTTVRLIGAPQPVADGGEAEVPPSAPPANQSVKRNY